MPDASGWLVFVAASVALLVTPGPAVLYVVTRSLADGRRLGLVSVAGIAVGTLGHVAAATLGLSAVLSSSELAFTIVKVAGAAYLVWVGLGRMVSRGGTGSASPASVPSGAWATFRQGVIVNLLNPKTALFFLAFLPQFVDRRHVIGPQMLALGLTFAVLGVTTDALYALLAGAVRRALVRGDARRTMLLQRWLTGLVFIALGVTAAFTQPSA